MIASGAGLSSAQPAWSVEIGVSLRESRGVMSVQPHESERFWNQVSRLVNRCGILPYEWDELAQTKHFYWIESQSPEELSLLSDHQAQFKIDGVSYSAHLVASEDADGGDLAHIVVFDDRGVEVARRVNVPAFGDLLLGLAGGHFAGKMEQVDGGPSR